MRPKRANCREDRFLPFQTVTNSQSVWLASNGSFCSVLPRHHSHARAVGLGDGQTVVRSSLLHPHEIHPHQTRMPLQIVWISSKKISFFASSHYLLTICLEGRPSAGKVASHRRPQEGEPGSWQPSYFRLHRPRHRTAPAQRARSASGDGHVRHEIVLRFQNIALRAKVRRRRPFRTIDLSMP